MAGKVTPKPVKRPGGAGQIVARGGSFVAVIDLESGASFERRVYVADEATCSSPPAAARRRGGEGGRGGRAAQSRDPASRTSVLGESNA